MPSGRADPRVGSADYPGRMCVFVVVQPVCMFARVVIVVVSNMLCSVMPVKFVCSQVEDHIVSSVASGYSGTGHWLQSVFLSMPIIVVAV